MSDTHLVVIRHRGTREIVKTMGPMSESKAEKMLNGVLSKLSEDYFADVKPVIVKGATKNDRADLMPLELVQAG